MENVEMSIFSSRWARFIKKIDVFPVCKYNIPEEVNKYLNANMILAGGALVSILTNTAINDFDIFCIKKAPDQEYLNSIDYNMYETPLIINTYVKINNKSFVVQIVKKIFANISDLLINMDFDICRFYYMDGIIYGTASAIYALNNKINILNIKSLGPNFSERLISYQVRKNIKFMNIYDNLEEKIKNYFPKKHLKIYYNVDRKLFDNMISGKDYAYSIEKNKIYRFEQLLFYYRYYINSFANSIKHYGILNNSHEFKIKLIHQLMKIEYNNYLKIKEFCSYYWQPLLSYKIHDDYPYIITKRLIYFIIILKLKKMPKYIRHMIINCYFNSLRTL